MDNPVDNIIDLGLVNYVAHPENKNFVVFRIPDIERAISFEALLVEQEIWFEKGEEDKRGKVYTLFGIKNSDFKKAEKINFTVEAKHKKPFIPFRGFRWFVILIGVSILVLSLIGYCKAQKTLEESNRNTEQSIIQHLEKNSKGKWLTCNKFTT